MAVLFYIMLITIHTMHCVYVHCEIHIIIVQNITQNTTDKKKKGTTIIKGQQNKNHVSCLILWLKTKNVTGVYRKKIIVNVVIDII